MIYETREAWLIALVEALHPMFEGEALTIPETTISCSWPSRMPRKRIGECWTSKAAKDGKRHMFISPTLDDAGRVADVTVHELIHACLPDGVGHKGPFVRAMKALGLEGKPTATTAGEDLARRLHAITSDLGAYPHKALSLDDGKKKQGTRMLKLLCPDCGYTARTTAKWIEVGLPTCCCGTTMEEA